jgi:hypothetical protein
MYRGIRSTEDKVSVRVGLHGRNDVEFHERDYELIRIAKIKTMKMMSFTSSKVFERIAAENPGIEFIVRLYDDRFGPGSVPRATEFITRMMPEVDRLRLFARKFEVHNEPNHVTGLEGWGATEQDARSFRSWYDLVYPSLKANAPWATFGFPGLAPNWPHNDILWLDVCRKQVQKSDWLGCHTYWQYENMLSDDWGLRFKRYRIKFPQKRIEITEFGDSTPARSPEEIARLYPAYYTELQKYPYIGSASSFIMSSPDPQWEPFAWRQESGYFMPVVFAVGDLDFDNWQPETKNIINELETHPTKTYTTRNLANIEYFVVHHSAVPASVGPDAIASYHVNARVVKNGEVIKTRWPGIGYHYVIADSGLVYKTNELETVSYHAGSYNDVSIGVCLLGAFVKVTKPDGSVVRHYPTAAQIDSASWLYGQLSKLFPGIKLVGHKEIAPTRCPGDTWRPWKALIQAGL